MELIDFKYKRGKCNKLKINADFKSSKVNLVLSNHSKTHSRTLLIRVLGGKYFRNDRLEGIIKINGITINRSELKNYSTFVFKECIFDESMTVAETIGMPLRLKRPQESALNGEKVEEMIELFGFRGVEKKIIRNAGLTRCQLKNLMISQQLSMDPLIMCLEDPFHDMDAMDSKRLINLLSTISRKGTAIIISTKQLCQEYMSFADHLLLLQEKDDDSGGTTSSTIYNGPSSVAIDYFNGVGIHVPDLSGLEMVFEEGNEMNLAEYWRSKGFSATRDIDQAFQRQQEPALTPNQTLSKHPPFFTLLGFTVIRRIKGYKRIPIVLVKKYSENLAIAIYIGLVYLNQSQYSFTDQVINITGALYYICIYTFVNGMFFSVPNETLVVYWREFGNYSMASSPTRWIAHLLIEVCNLFVSSYLFVLVLYYMIGFDPAFSNYLLISLFAMMTALNGFAIGVLLNTLIDKKEWAQAATIYIIFPFILISGRFEATLPTWISWQRYVSPIYYSYRGMLETELDREFENCDRLVETTCNGLVEFISKGNGDGLSLGVYLLLSIALFFAIWMGSFIMVSIRGKFGYYQKS